MNKRVKKFFVSIVAVIALVFVFNGISGILKKVKNSYMWKKIGIEAYDKDLLVISDKKYFYNDMNGNICFYIEKEPKEPYCLVVPATYNGETAKNFMGIADSQYIVDLIILSSESVGMIERCPSLKRVVYGENVGTSYASVTDEAMYDYCAYIDGTQQCPNISKVTFAENKNFMHIDDFLDKNRIKNIDFPENTISINCLNFEITAFVAPGKLREIESSLINNDFLVYVEFQDGLEKITDSFLYSHNIEYAVIPSTVKEIENSFVDCGNVCFVVEADSYAEEFAKHNNIRYKNKDEFDIEAYKAEYHYYFSGE